MKIGVGFEFALSLAMIFLFNSFEYSLIFLISALIHEAGHIFFLKLYKIKKPELILGLLGAELRADLSRLSYREEIAVYLGGAGANLAVCAACIGALHIRFSDEVFFFFFSNFFYALLNLMPVKTLDGGRALECAVLMLCADPWCAVKIAETVSFVFSVLLCAAFTLSAFYIGINPTALLLVAWLVFQCIFSKPCCRSAS